MPHAALLSHLVSEKEVGSVQSFWSFCLGGLEAVEGGKDKGSLNESEMSLPF